MAPIVLSVPPSSNDLAFSILITGLVVSSMAVLALVACACCKIKKKKGKDVKTEVKVEAVENLNSVSATPMTLTSSDATVDTVAETEPLVEEELVFEEELVAEAEPVVEAKASESVLQEKQVEKEPVKAVTESATPLAKGKVQPKTPYYIYVDGRTANQSSGPAGKAEQYRTLHNVHSGFLATARPATKTTECKTIPKALKAKIFGIRAKTGIERKLSTGKKSVEGAKDDGKYIIMSTTTAPDDGCYLSLNQTAKSLLPKKDDGLAMSKAPVDGDYISLAPTTSPSPSTRLSLSATSTGSPPSTTTTTAAPTSTSKRTTTKKVSRTPELVTVQISSAASPLKVSKKGKVAKKTAKKTTIKTPKKIGTKRAKKTAKKTAIPKPGIGKKAGSGKKPKAALLSRRL